MDKQQVSEKRKKNIRRWLKFLHQEQKIHCPFYYDLTHRFCYSWFPRCSDVTACPCSVYSLSYVKRIAKKMLETI